jgi:hypothetical protein
MPALFALGYYLHLPLLIVLVSLVYGGTRYDEWRFILREAFRWGLRLLGFLAAVVLVLFLAANLS